MNMLGLVRGNDGAFQIANPKELLARYQQLRKTSRKLNNKLVARLSKNVLDEGGTKLGILRNGTLVFHSMDESAVLMDYCLYDVRRNGRNVIEQYLIDSPPDEDSEEMTCLRAMQHAIYSLFVVESVEPGLGVVVRDAASDESMLVVDMGFASSALPGVVFASRLLPYDGFFITGGAALPLGVLPESSQNAAARNLLAATAAEGHSNPASLIRGCLSQGCSENIQYQAPQGATIGHPRSSDSRRSTAPGRNSPCPCGSGKKHKACCLKHR